MSSRIGLVLFLTILSSGISTVPRAAHAISGGNHGRGPQRVAQQGQPNASSARQLQALWRHIVEQRKHAKRKATTGGQVLILSTTLYQPAGPGSSPEEQAAVMAGETPVVVDPTTWEGMTASQFASYDALILGDPDCTSPADPYITAAESTASIWGPIVSGDVIVIGTDPVYHGYNPGGHPGAQTLIQNGVAFAVSAGHGKTGAYIDLSCYYSGTSPHTDVPVMDNAFASGIANTFQVTGVPCGTSVHIVGTGPALNGLTDSNLSGWSCSDHEAFDNNSEPNKAVPPDWTVLVIALDGGQYVAPDGTNGDPYIIARGPGVTVISDIKLNPLSGINKVGAYHTVTATVLVNHKPQPATAVNFSVISGPNTGASGTAATNGKGQATFTYTSRVAGTDFLDAQFTDPTGRIQTSNTVTETWVSPTTPTPTPTHTPTNTPTNTPTRTPTNTPTNTPTPTDTPTNTPTSTPTSTPTNTPIPPQIYLNETVDVEGDTNRVTGVHFGPHETVTAYLSQGSDPLGLTLGSATTNAEGTFTGTNGISFTVPMTLPNGFVVTAIGQNSKLLATIGLAVIPGFGLDIYQGPPGSTPDANGYGFYPNETVTFYWNCPNYPCTGDQVLATAKADAQGRITTYPDLPIPSTATAGTYPVAAQGSSGNIYDFNRTYFTVT